MVLTIGNSLAIPSDVHWLFGHPLREATVLLLSNRTGLYKYGQLFTKHKNCSATLSFGLSLGVSIQFAALGTSRRNAFEWKCRAYFKNWCFSGVFYFRSGFRFGLRIPITTISVAAHGTCAPKGSVLRPGRICVFFRSSAAVRLCGDCVLLWCFPDCSRRLRTVAALGTCRPEESTLMLRSLGRVGACRTQNTYPNLLVLLFIKDAHSGDFSTPNLFLRASN